MNERYRDAQMVNLNPIRTLPLLRQSCRAADSRRGDLAASDRSERAMSERPRFLKLDLSGGCDGENTWPARRANRRIRPSSVSHVGTRLITAPLSSPRSRGRGAFFYKPLSPTSIRRANVNEASQSPREDGCGRWGSFCQRDIRYRQSSWLVRGNDRCGFIRNARQCLTLPRFCANHSGIDSKAEGFPRRPSAWIVGGFRA